MSLDDEPRVASDTNAPRRLPRFAVGTRVHHNRFKGGTVHEAADGKVRVLFDSVGIKEISETYAELTDLVAEATRISPTWPQIRDITTFRPRLTRGELELAEYFDMNLPPGWRIYVRPHLDGDLPSVALLGQDEGAMLWDVVEPRYESEDPPIAPYAATPLKRLERIRERVYHEYLPEIGEQFLGNKSRFGLVRLGVYFPSHTRSAMEPSSGDRHVSIVAQGELRQDALGSIVPILSRRDFLSGDEWSRLDHLFSHYSRNPPALEALTLAKDQEALARPRLGRHHLTGVAGSGKSVVLAHRAARNAMAGRRVLVLTFNRTLTNYMRHLVGLVPGRFPQDRIAVRHFHGICVELLHPWSYLGEKLAVGSDLTWSRNGEQTGDLEQWLENELPRRALERLREGVPERFQYDSVLIDEGQDFSSEFLEVAEQLAFGPEPEVVVATDAAQRLYLRRSGVSYEPIAARYKKLRPLKVGVRSPRSVAQAANEFIDRWQLDSPHIELPPEGLDLGLDRSLVAWREATSAGEAAALAVQLIQDWIGRRGIRPDLVAVLVPSKESGAAVVQVLAENGIAANHIFAVGKTGAPMDDSAPAPDGERGRVLFVTNKKRSFRVDDQRLKVCTIHSFKGWESHHVVCVLPGVREPDERQIAQVYVALTRSRQDVALIGVGDPFGLGEIAKDDLNFLKPDVRDAQRYDELLVAAAEKELLRSSHSAPPDELPRLD